MFIEEYANENLAKEYKDDIEQK